MATYNFFVFTKPVAGNDKVVVTGRVNHSQQAKDTPLKARLPAKGDCMTGLCEACSYVEALLFVTNAAIRTRESVTCTQQKNRWVMPSYVDGVPYISICEMDLSSVKKRYSTLGEQGSATQTSERGQLLKQPQQKNRLTFAKHFNVYDQTSHSSHCCTL